MRRPMCVYATLFLLCLAVLLPFFSDIPADYDRLPQIEDRTAVCVCGTITNMTEKNGNLVVTLSDVKFEPNELLGTGLGVQNPTGPGVQNCGLLLYFPLQQPESYLKMSRIIRVAGIYHKFQTAENTGQFDTRKHYTLKGVDGYLLEPRLLGVASPYDRVKQALYQVKRQIMDIYAAFLSEEDAGVLTALITGDKGELDPEIRELYQNAGIAHILSLSGLHVAIFGLGLLNILKTAIRKFFASCKICMDLGRGGQLSTLISAIIAVVILVLWCIMTGFAVSTIRALIMFVMGVIADLCNRTYDLLSAAAAASVLTVIISPLYLYDAGFQLSFGAVVSIGILQPLLINLTGKYGKNRIVQGLLLSLSIQLGTIPVVAIHFHQVALGGFFLNLIVVPLMTVVVLGGVVLAVLGCMLSLPCGAVLVILCKISALITHVILFIYDKCAVFATSLPRGIWVIGHPNAPKVAFYYGLLIVFIIVAGYLGKEKARKGAGGGMIIQSDQSGRHKIGLQRFFRDHFQFFRNMLICGVYIIISAVIIDTSPGNELMICNLSVGQGDCSAIFGYTHVIIIDCGSSSENEVGKYRLVPRLKAAGAGSVHTIFVTHFDADHVNGLIDLLSDPVYGKRVGRIVLSCMAPVFDGDTDNYKTLVMLAKENGIPIFLMRAGESLEIGELQFLCVSPDMSPVQEDMGAKTVAGRAAETYSDTNEASLVLRMQDKKSGFRALFTGDIGEEAENRILAEWGREDLVCDYLKVAHHGSRGSSMDAFLQAVFRRTGTDENAAQRTDMDVTGVGDPAAGPVAVISVAKNSRYGHPHKEALDRLNAVWGLRLYRTDQNGEVILNCNAKGWHMETFLKQRIYRCQDSTDTSGSDL